MVYDDKELIVIVHRDSLQVSLWKCYKDGITRYPVETKVLVGGSYVVVPTLSNDDLIIASEIYLQISDKIYQAVQTEANQAAARKQMDEAIRVSDEWRIGDVCESG